MFDNFNSLSFFVCLRVNDLAQQFDFTLIFFIFFKFQNTFRWFLIDAVFSEACFLIIWIQELDGFEVRI